MNANRLSDLWQGQPAPELELNVEDLRSGCARFEHAIARRNGIETAAGIAVMCVSGFYLWWIPDPVARLGCLLMLAGVAVVLWQLRRRAGLQRQAPDDLAQPTLGYLRAQLSRQREALRTVARWYLGPLVPGLAVFLVGLDRIVWPIEAARFPAVAASLACAAVFPLVWWLNRRAAAALQRQIEQLDRLRAA